MVLRLRHSIEHPLQCFACWRGASTKTPAHVLCSGENRFRSPSNFRMQGQSTLPENPAGDEATGGLGHGGTGLSQNTSWLIELLSRAWQFRNGRFHDPSHLSLIVQADGNALSDRQSLKQVRPRHHEHNCLA